MRARPDHIVRLAAFGACALAALAAAVELSRREPSLEITASSSDTDPLHTDLVRCRTLTPDEVETDTACKKAWAENRRRFFGSTLDRSDTE